MPVHMFNNHRSCNGFRSALILEVYIKAAENFSFGSFLCNKIGRLHEAETELYRFSQNSFIVKKGT